MNEMCCISNCVLDILYSLKILTRFFSRNKKKVSRNGSTITKNPRNPSGIQYDCPECPFQTSYKSNLKRHSIVHKSDEEKELLKRKRKVFRCSECSYTSMDRRSFANHVQSHRPPECDPLEEIKSVFKCSACAYTTKVVTKMRKHLFSHASSTQLNLPLYKCDTCSFETHVQKYMKNHAIVHETSEDRRKRLELQPMLKCEKCSYETKIKKNLTKHVFKHKSLEERRRIKQQNAIKYIKNRRKISTLFQCENCSFATPVRSELDHHKAVHKKSEEFNL